MKKEKSKQTNKGNNELLRRMGCLCKNISELTCYIFSEKCFGIIAVQDQKVERY